MFRSIILPALSALAAPAVAQSTPIPHAELDRIVARFTGMAIGQPGGAREPVDRRLRLRACGSDPVASWHGAPGRTVQIACPDGGGWRIFVNLVVGPATTSRQPAVRRGESLTVAVTGRGFTVRRTAQALSAGAVGDWIPVRTSDGSEPVRARLVQPGLAEIPLDGSQGG
ncbi:flagella basal body P-ring formation protein FlgA [Altererythrobacter sp. H2]|uniref:flagella basal body P-ring formation protein FlgA n=1 Tax=Altererythrobacter sp. H2 TaxID=3108391 RepID=UPI002B4C0718|nr:flagella basal body P-ring formation protein FlgA [Altererythrobacter sp. H2]WRK95324.1 flagella basal body P-ring formation protein FlgA [Altererythrobacter sp. H2]